MNEREIKPEYTLPRLRCGLLADSSPAPPWQWRKRSNGWQAEPCQLLSQKFDGPVELIKFNQNFTILLQLPPQSELLSTSCWPS
jgi:hypothetical protein